MDRIISLTLFSLGYGWLSGLQVYASCSNPSFYPPQSLTAEHYLSTHHSAIINDWDCFDAGSEPLLNHIFFSQANLSNLDVVHKLVN